ncbi:MAG: hypothetical protein ACRDZX_07185 [Acidimicrobiales bacterium]
MRRKSFDVIVSTGGLLLTLVLVAAGALLFWGYSYANNTVSAQLTAQQVTFPPQSAFAHARPGGEVTPQMTPYLERYAGEKLTTGAQAEAYANHFIAYHLAEMPYGGVYAKVSAAAHLAPAGTAQGAQLASLEQTVFQGTSLRGMLLNAYGWWQIGQIALIGSIVSFILAALTLVLSGLGLWHFRRVPVDEEIPRLRTATGFGQGGQPMANAGL